LYHQIALDPPGAAPFKKATLSVRNVIIDFKEVTTGQRRRHPLSPQQPYDHDETCNKWKKVNCVVLKVVKWVCQIKAN